MPGRQGAVQTLGRLLPFPGLFEIVESELRRPGHQLTVSYHPAMGYPESIGVDPIGSAVDDEYSYRVTSLHTRR